MPDERAVMTYVSSYYHCFSGAQKVGFLIFEKKKENIYSFIIKIGCKYGNLNQRIKLKSIILIHS